MTFAIWCVVIGGLLGVMALSGSVFRRLPISAAMVYLAVGYSLSPAGAGLIRIDPISDAQLFEYLTEIAVVVSLFVAGLKLRVPLRDRLWRLPVRMATVSMTLTVGLVAVVGVFALGLPIGVAVLLGAVLAPTDPVLAADVQVTHPGDRDKLRFALTGEAGLNDGTAFPFVMLGLGLLGLHDLGAGWWRWWAVDVVWAVAAGLGVGFALGTLTAKLVLYLRQKHREAIGLDNFLALGLIAMSYGITLLLHGYGFLAVFAAGLALRHEEMRRGQGGSQPAAPPTPPGTEQTEAAFNPAMAPVYMVEEVLDFTSQVDRLLEVAAVVITGALVTAVRPTWEAVGLAVVLFVVIRPLSVFAGMPGQSVRRWLAGWFGVRGIGSLYYLMFAIGHGLPEELARRLTELVVWTVVFSIVVHGVSVTPLMDWYTSRQKN